MKNKFVSYVYLFGSGFFLAAGIFLAFEAQREYRLFKSIVDAENGLPFEHSPDKPPRTESLPAFRSHGYPVRMMNVVHVLLKERGRVFSGRDYPVREYLYTSGSDHLTSGQGACAAFSWVLTEALQVAGYSANMAQIRCEDNSLCHTVVEVNDKGRRVVLDPVQNLFYLNHEMQPATLEEINLGNVTMFEDSIPTTILDIRDLQSDPTMVVYTNWKRIPLVGEAIGKLLASAGTEFSRLSIRSNFLNVHQSLSVASAISSIAFFALFLGANRLRRD